ncbi:hypothetical protein ILUMI_19761, partial [Ignelater luminosus]
MLNFWHFSNNEEAPPEDRIYKVRTLIEMLVQRYKEIMKPDRRIAVDESMVPFRGRLKFRQYLPLKKHKENRNWRKDLATHVVLNLLKNYLDSGRILISDNFYTNIPLAHELLRRKTHSLGTIRKYRKGIPKEIVTTKLNKGEVTGKEDEKGVMIARWKDKRDVLILSTHHTLEIVNTGKKNRKQEEIFKPQFVVDYNGGKGGIDISDQLSSYSTPVRKSIRWYHKLATEVLFGTTVVNAFVLYKRLRPQNTKIKITRFREQLIDGFLFSEDLQELSSEEPTKPIKKKKISHVLAETKDTCNRNRKIRKRCYMCYDKISSMHGGKAAAKMTKKCYVSKDGNDWDEFLNFATYCCNTHVHKSTSKTTFELVFGELPKIPNLLKHPQQKPNYSNLARELTSKLQTIREAAKENQNKSKEKKATLDEIEAERLENENVDVVYIPPDVDELTDQEDIDEY